MPMKPKDKTKRCSGCKRVFKLEAFYSANDYTQSGKQRAICNPCWRKAGRDYKARNKAKVYAASASYRENNKQKLAERQRAWREANPDRYYDIHSRWKRNNKDSVNASTHKRRAVLAQSQENYTPREWRALKARYGNRCLMCGLKRPLTVDHVIPIVMGGNNTIHNIQPLCKPCNSKKGVTVLDLRMQVATVTSLRVVK